MKALRIAWPGRRAAPAGLMALLCAVALLPSAFGGIGRPRGDFDPQDVIKSVRLGIDSVCSSQTSCEQCALARAPSVYCDSADRSMDNDPDSCDYVMASTPCTWDFSRLPGQGGCYGLSDDQLNLSGRGPSMHPTLKMQYEVTHEVTPEKGVERSKRICQNWHRVIDLVKFARTHNSGDHWHFSRSNEAWCYRNTIGTLQELVDVLDKNGEDYTVNNAALEILAMAQREINIGQKSVHEANVPLYTIPLSELAHSVVTFYRFHGGMLPFRFIQNIRSSLQVGDVHKLHFPDVDTLSQAHMLRLLAAQRGSPGRVNLNSAMAVASLQGLTRNNYNAEYMGFVSNLAVFAVFDGHNGDLTSKYLAKEIPVILGTVCQEKCHKSLRDMKFSIEKTLKLVHERIRNNRQWDDSGSTVMMVAYSFDIGKFVFAHMGNSRAFLVKKDNNIAFETRPHTLHDPSEKAYVHAQGHSSAPYVQNSEGKKVYVARSLGDTSFHGDIIDRTPTLSVFDESEDLSALVLASHSLFETETNDRVLTPEYIAKGFLPGDVTSRMTERNDKATLKFAHPLVILMEKYRLLEIATGMADLAVTGRKARDNVSVVLVNLQRLRALSGVVRMMDGTLRTGCAISECLRDEFILNNLHNAGLECNTSGRQVRFKAVSDYVQQVIGTIPLENLSGTPRKFPDMGSPSGSVTSGSSGQESSTDKSDSTKDDDILEPADSVIHDDTIDGTISERSMPPLVEEDQDPAEWPDEPAGEPAYGGAGQWQLTTGALKEHNRLLGIDDEDLESKTVDDELESNGLPLVLSDLKRAGSAALPDSVDDLRKNSPPEPFRLFRDISKDDDTSIHAHELSSVHSSEFESDDGSD